MNEQAFEAAIRRLEPKLYRMAYAILWNSDDAADAMQETILRAWQKRGSLRDEMRFDAWVMRILINESRNIQRRSHYRDVPLDKVEYMAGEEAPEDSGLRDALRQLPERERVCLLLHEMNGYDYREIGAMLHLPSGTVGSRISRAKKTLRRLLGEEADT